MSTGEGTADIDQVRARHPEREIRLEGFTYVASDPTGLLPPVESGRLDFLEAGKAVNSIVPRYVQAADVVRGQVADGTLKPGSPVPSGAALARLTGFSQITCRKALRSLVDEGVLSPGATPNARLQVAASGEAPAPAAVAAGRMSAGLAGRRRAARLTQHELAVKLGYSVTTVGHAESGRTWQGRGFWERADDVLAAGGELLRLYDACRAAAHPTVIDDAAAGAPEPGPVCLLAVWGDGSVAAVPRHLAALIADELRAARAEAAGHELGLRDRATPRDAGGLQGPREDLG